MIKFNDIWKWIKEKPKDFTIVFLLLLFIFTTILFWLRLSGQTVQLPFLEKYVKVVPEGTPHTVTAEQLNKYTRIVGKYKYRCKSNEKNHGGVCTISLITTDNGLQWRLDGERRWEEPKDSAGNIITKKNLDFPYKWTTSWGGFLADDRIAFSYEITSKTKHIKGYAEGEINSTDYISGRYWQLPPDDPLYGYFEFKRRVDDSDTEW